MACYVCAQAPNAFLETQCGLREKSLGHGDHALTRSLIQEQPCSQVLSLMALPVTPRNLITPGSGCHAQH